MLDVARSPFADQHYYFTYSRDTGESIETVLAIGKLVNEQIVELKDIFVTQSGASSGRHFGSRIAFDDQYVYFSVGDRGERANGQDLNTHAGSILRLLPDGSIPAGNPFHAPKESANAIWSYGHRNPQGLYYDNGSQQLWSVEHGPRGGDEVNIIEKGSNYGWPITSHGKEYWGPIKVGEAEEMEGIQSPKYVYVPSIAPSSLVVYRGKNYPELNNALLMGSLKFTHINVVHWQQGQPYKEQRIVGELGERVRSLLVTPDDRILFSTDSGNIYYLLPRAE
ncbi:PQQ-dependent oxidoreductase gdhB family [Vibrio ponticus]|nr:PQQ-dependent oxidoreductase gdhB family [Vibrio ponticus]